MVEAALAAWRMLRRNIVILVRVNWLAKICSCVHRIGYAAWYRLDWWSRRQGGRRPLKSKVQWLLKSVLLVVPAPLLNQPVNHEVDAPASLFVDLVDDGENFFLLGTGDKTFPCVVN